MNSIPIIKIDNVVQFYMLNEKCEWGDEDFPNVAPPFEKFTLEYTLPEHICINGKINKHPLGLSYWIALYQAIYCEADTIFHNIRVPEDGWMLFAHVRSNVHLQFQALVFCNKYGILTPAFNIQGKMRSIQLMLQPGLPYDVFQMSEFCTTMIQPQLLALSFMHCKNVQKEEVDPNKDLPQRVLKHWEKKGKQLLDKYYTLNIEPMKTILKTKGQSEKNGIKQALHICRGHFKDYSEGKGLFGKYHGLYWWEDCMKGDRSHGEVSKSYNISV